jgi:fatty acid amide hydrolase 2
VESPLELSASKIAALIRSRDLTALEAVDAHVAQIRRVNPRLNAVVRERFESARAEAREADARIEAAGAAPLPPLLGVPCTIKESIAVQGMPNSSGVMARAGLRAAADATVVARLRAAGAIPLGVTNTPEITIGATTFNRVYGRTNNARDSERIAGGSSGGEGAIIGAGGSPFGIGTDIGGSIRVPAFCNGIFGHKPTGGLVPGTGQYPPYEGALRRYNATGPLARRAEDLMPLLRILAGPDEHDGGCVDMELGDAGVDVASLRVFVVADEDAGPRADRELRDAQQNAAYALASLGARVVTRRLGSLAGSLHAWEGLVTEAGGIPVASLLGNGARISLLAELLRLLIGRSVHAPTPIVAGLALRIAGLFPARMRRLAESGRALRAELEALLGNDGVLLVASARGIPPRHSELRGRLALLYFPYCAVFNVLEFPVTQVPLGTSAEHGMPLGVQVAAGRGRDHLTIAVACALERACGGWSPPPVLRP